MEQKEFYKKLEKIIDMTDTCHGHYDDVGGDWRVYDKLDMLIDNSLASECIKDELRNAQKKMREAFLLLKDTAMKIAMFD